MELILVALAERGFQQLVPMLYQLTHLVIECAITGKDDQGWDYGCKIVRPELPLSPLAIPAYTDAAGRSWKVGHGLGGVIPPKEWFYILWPRWLNEGKSNS